MKIRTFFCIVITSALLSGCTSSSYVKKEKTVYAMDTVMELSFYGFGAEQALAEAETEIFKYDAAFRRKSENSEIYAINQNGTCSVSDETAQLMQKALSVCRLTNGAFDISVAPLMDLWGFYTKAYRVPSEEELAKTLPKVSYTHIRVDGNTVSVFDGAEIDAGGIAKGFLSDRIMEICRANGVSSAIVSLGGHVHVLGAKPDKSPWHVAVRDPVDENRYVGILSVTDTAVVTSGGYQRFFEQDGRTYHHILDPKTGYPADSGLLSVTVVCRDGTLADGLSTALFVMGPENGTALWRAHPDFEAIFVTEKDGIYITKGLQGIFTCETAYQIID